MSSESLTRLDVSEPMRETMLHLGAESFIADLSGALIHPASETLIIADMHLEKGSFFAMRRQMLPPYDSAATLARLTAVVARRRPRRIIALGDTFHDRDGPNRLTSDCNDALAHLARSAELIFVSGNHDPRETFNGRAGCVDEISIGAVSLRHEAVAGRGPQIAGHLHPVALVVSTKGAARRRCFAEGRDTLILPAFGAYAGGLNIRDRAFLAVMQGDIPKAHVLGASRIFSVETSRTRPD
jgi:uncharacterized protein